MVAPEQSIPHLSRFDAILVDLDGTIYREEEGSQRVLPGAVDLLQHLRQTRQPYACLTNSGSSPRQLAARLAEMGAPVDETHIWSCVAALAEYVSHRWPDGARVFNMATDGVADLLSEPARKITWVTDETQPCDLVIAAAPVNSWAQPDRQWIALQLLRKGATLIGCCADRVYPSHRGLEFGSGGITLMLAYAASVTPIFCGKPEPVFFLELCQRLAVRPDRCLLIGDNLESDIAGAKSVGMSSLLVLTGVATYADVLQLPPEKRPDFITPDLRSLLP